MKPKSIKLEGKKESSANKSSQGQKGWKILAISVIIVFALFIIGGLIKAHNLRSSFVKPTEAQVDYAKKLAIGKIQAAGVNISAFNIDVSERIRMPRDDRGNKTILQVVFYNNTITHVYLVDINTGKIIMHTETEVYEEMPKQDKPQHDNGFRLPFGLPSPRSFPFKITERDVNHD